MAILLMVINSYSISDYWLLYEWLLLIILLMVIDAYSISGYWCLLMVIILVAILLMAIGEYFIGGY